MTVLLFGIAKDIVGSSSLHFSNAQKAPGSVLALKERLKATYPQFGKLSSLAIAVNSEYAKDDMLLKVTDEVAIIPPVSGG